MSSRDADRPLDAEAQKEAEERLRSALDSVGDGAFDWNVRTGEIFCSDRWYESIGFQRSDFGRLVDFWTEVVHPEDVQLLEDAIGSHVAGHTLELDVEYRIRTRSGTFRWTQLRGRVIECDEAGNAIRVVGTNFDISFAKRVQLSLDELEGRCRSIVNTAGCIIVVLDGDGCIQEWNPAAERIYGFPAEAVRGKRYAEWFLPEAYRKPVQLEIDRMMAGGESTRNFENPILTRDGTEHQVLWNASALLNSEGVPWAVVAIGQDITEWRAAERDRRIALDEKARAQERVRAMSQALDRCSSCGHVRTEGGHWHSLEDHLGLEVGNAICPSCTSD